MEASGEWLSARTSLKVWHQKLPHLLKMQQFPRLVKCTIYVVQLTECMVHRISPWSVLDKVPVSCGGRSNFGRSAVSGMTAISFDRSAVCGMTPISFARSAISGMTAISFDRSAVSDMTAISFDRSAVSGMTAIMQRLAR